MNKNYLKKNNLSLEQELSNPKSVRESNMSSFQGDEQPLMDNDTKLQGLSNNIPAYIGYVNADTLKYEFVNDLYAESFGIPRDKIIGSHIKNVIGAENYRFALKYIEDAKSGKSSRYENIFEMASGKRWIQVNYSPVLDTNNHVTAIALLSYDITDRKHAEETLALHNNALLKLNRFAIELSNLSSDDILEVFIARQIKEITGAAVAIFSEYNSSDRTTTTRHIEMEPGLLKKVVGLLGRQVQDIHSFVSDEMYQEMTTDMIGMRKTIYEASFGAIPRSVGAAIQSLLKVDRIIGVAYLIEGKLYGTSLLAMRKGQADPPREILENFVHLAASSLRRKRAEEMLLKSELMYRSLIENSTDAIFCVDEKGQYQFTNHLFASTFGKTPDHFIGKTFWDIYPKEYADSSYESTKRVWQTGKKESLEVEVPLPDKTLYFLATTNPIKDETGKVVLMLTHSTDITELKKTQRALEVSSQFNSQIINSVQEGIIVYDLYLHYQLWNPFMEQLYGIPASQVLGKHPSELFRFIGEAGVIDNLKKTSIGEITDAIDFPFDLPVSGKSGWTSVKNVPFRDVNGEIIGVIGTVYDITVRKQAEEELKNKIVELMNAYKQLEEFAFYNKELKQFAYISSHQLQQPLRTIKNFVQIFEEDYSDLFDENAIKHLKTIKDSTERMNSLILALSDYSRLGLNKKLKTVDFNKIVSDVMADLHDKIETTNTSIEVTEMPVIKAYEVEIRQVFQNLIENSIKFQAENNRPEIQICSEKMDSKWKFSVRDNGIGIAPEQYEKLFHMFQRLHIDEIQFEGKGIGLAFCKKIIELHQGEIWVESNKFQGVTFYFTIPGLTV
jgi:PAS domain S-box-containing protein